MAPPMKFSRVHKESDEPEAPSNNLWVGNLAPDVTDSDLMDLFAKYGALDSVTTYSSRSYAFLYFKHVEDAAAAKDALQGTLLRGNPVKIEFARPAKPSKNLWVGGISPAVSKEQLEEEFLKFGKIEEFKFLRDRNTAFIEYVKLEDALEAMRSMNGKRLGGDQIRVDFLRSQSVRRFTVSVLMPLFVMFQHSQTSGGRKEGPPSNVLWVGYPPSVQIDEQMLHNAMILFGEIERIKSFPARHYSFVEFRSVDEARRAKEGLQGRLFNDPRISIMYSSSELAPGKEYSSFNAGGKGPRPEIFNENLPNLQLRPFGPQGSFDPVLSGAEFNDLAPLHSFRDGNSNIPTGPNWRRPSPPASGILPSPASRVRPPMRSVSTGWDVLDPSQYQREPKRSRLDASLPIDEDAFPSRNRFGPPADAGGPHQHRIDHDFIWRGIIAKGGTPVCNARCVPLDKGMDLELPEVVNCSARTGLDMLTKHYAEAIGFDIVFFLPDSEDDFASYTEFLRYLGSKNRAGVAKFDDGTTLFLVPPSDFLTNVLKVKGPERLYGVVLKLPQQTPSSASIQPQLCQPNHIPQYMDRHQIPPPEIDYNQIARKEERFTPMDYNRILHEDSKPPSKIFYPPATESMTEQSVHQAYASNSTVAVSQAGVSWTPELIASLTSLLPANAQLSTLEGGQPVSGSLVVDKRTLHGWKHSGNTSHMQYGSQFNSESQAPLLSQPYPSISSAPNSSEIMVPGTAQIQDFSVNLPHQGGIASRPLNSVNLPSQGGQVALPPHVSQQYQLEVPHQKAYSGMMHGTEGSYSPSVIQQSNNPVVFSSQAQGGNHSQTQSGLPLSSDKVNWEVSSQLQTAPFVADQGTSEVEVDKNQRYQSTLQFAASLLLQIQQQQQQQTGNPAVRGSGNQQ
ncbi:RNA recognition motif-containing protein, putative [Ricinus communis]|uniref:RNA recognition motif-containing protein, putative n=1 Tax=Ricinus communis TaxID=3988 RepID=B9SU08_RICCO|nr:RNA recognition motif-containing protein, putative [Ricinus communis]